VKVGRHIPPSDDALPRFLKRFVEACQLQTLSRLRQIIAIGAAHHRLLWIHPFYDGNGRVARLMSHAHLISGCSMSNRGWLRNSEEVGRNRIYSHS
jgi:Fic family protein